MVRAGSITGHAGVAPCPARVSGSCAWLDGEERGDQARGGKWAGRLQRVAWRGDRPQGGRQLPGAPTALACDLLACLSREEDACALPGGLG